MQDLRWITLPDDGIDEFLGRGGTGLLSFTAGSDRPPVMRPVSYGYTARSREFFFRLSLPASAEKGAVVGQPVAFATFEQTDEGWHSVVATGRLEPLADRPAESSAVQKLWDVRIPAVDIFDRPRDEVALQDFRLDPDELSGRKEVRTE